MATYKDQYYGPNANKKAEELGSFACKKSAYTTEPALRDSIEHKKAKGHPYRPSLTGGGNHNYLSMKIIHKPSRSKDMLDKASDPTHANSILNSHISYNDYSTESEGETANVSPKYKDSELHNRLVRKKSGEFLKLSMKESNSYFDQKRTRSLPTTPTYKQVHFGGDNDIRYFKKKDKPTAISASNSPTLRGIDGDFKSFLLGSDNDNDDNGDDDDYNEDYDDSGENQAYFTLDLNSEGSTNFPGTHREKSISWNLQLSNFTPLSYDNHIKVLKSAVFLERIFISVDKKFLLGHIAVKNLAFEKSITVRYSLDNWCTIVEMPTIYVPDIPKILKANNYDRFIFRIPLDSLFNSFKMPTSSNRNGAKIQEQRYSLCIKYNTGSLEFWDNNNLKNYDFKLIKTIEGAKSATSKIQTHNSRPKYSTSYLKRRSSDSHLEVQSRKNDENQNNSSDYSSNDFIKNDFYMLSPLLSSLSNSNYDTEFLHNYSTDTLASSQSPSRNFYHAGNEIYGADNMNVDIRNKKDEDNSFRSNILDSKTYKELLDNYCFFSTDPEEPVVSSNVSHSPINSSTLNSDKNADLAPEEPNTADLHVGLSSAAGPKVTGDDIKSNKNGNSSRSDTYTISSILKV